MASASVCCGSRSVLRCLRSVSLCAASYPVSPHQSSAFREIRSVRSASGLRGHTAFPKNLPSDRDQESPWGRLPFFRPAPYPVPEGMTAPVGGREGGAVTTASPPLTPCGHLCCPSSLALREPPADRKGGQGCSAVLTATLSTAFALVSFPQARRVYAVGGGRVLRPTCSSGVLPQPENFCLKAKSCTSVLWCLLTSVEEGRRSLCVCV